MDIYFRCKDFFAVYVEMQLDLGKKPLFSIHKYYKEYVFDMPYTTLILTPASALKQNVNTYDQPEKETSDRPYST